MALLLAARGCLAFQCWEDAQGDRGPLWASLGTCNLAMDHRGARSPLISEPWVAALLSPAHGATSLEAPGTSSWLPPPSWVVAELGTPELGHTDGSGC